VAEKDLEHNMAAFPIGRVEEAGFVSRTFRLERIHAVFMADGQKGEAVLCWSMLRRE
jgi:hypothetical protein